MKRSATYILAFLGVLAFAASAQAQMRDASPEKSYGADGRLYSQDTDDYYLLWQRGGYGQGRGVETGGIRIHKKYELGAYEEKRLYFQIDCFETENPRFVPAVMFSEHEDFRDPSVPIEIPSPAKTPTSSKKASYNLYWAACHNQFRRFK